MSSHIQLPAERVEQLRMIAAARNCTVVEVVAGFIRAEIERGTIPSAVPGIDVARTDDATITIVANRFQATLPTNEGPTLADLMKQGGSLTTSDPERKKRWIEGLARLSGATVKRAGKGLKIVSPITGQEFPISLDIAADVADEINRAAK